MSDRTDRTFMCTVLFLDIVEYSKKPVSEQLKVKDRFNAHLAAAISDIAPSDRIILDTGDGAAINFLGDPEDALFVATALANLFSQTEHEARLEVRIGINLGPVRLHRDINGQPNIIGDGINVAHCVMGFAKAGEVLVSRAYFDVVTRISGDYAKLFVYQGSRTDKHVREHEIYALSAPAREAVETAMRGRGSRPAPVVPIAANADGPLPKSAQTRAFADRKMAFVAATLAGVALAAIVAFIVADARTNHGKPAAPVTVVAAPIRPAPPAQPAPAQSAIKVADAGTTSEPLKGTLPATLVASGSETPSAPKAGRNRKTVVATNNVAEKTTPIRVEPQSAAAPATAVPETTASIAATAPITSPAPVAKATDRSAGVVSLAISPWGEVFVDGKAAGVSPPTAELELAAGTHTIEIRNSSFKPYVETVELASNQTVRIKHKFTNK